MNELLTKKLAEIVNSNHLAAPVLEKYHLDYCCKGKRTLEQACTELSLNPVDVIAELEQTKERNSGSVAFNYGNMALGQLADHIVETHHQYVKKEMPAIQGYLQKVAAKHGARHPEMIKVLELFNAVKKEMEEHMQKEEVILFPRIKEVEKRVGTGKEIVSNSSYLLSPIAMMEEEHDHAGNTLDEIRQLTSNYAPPADACTTYQLSLAALHAFELDLHQHVHLENNTLFPKALQLFAQPSAVSLS